jgi:hypothetical protein
VRRVIFLLYRALKKQGELNLSFLCPTTYFNVSEAGVLFYSKTFLPVYVMLLRVSGIDFTHTHKSPGSVSF